MIPKQYDLGDGMTLTALTTDHFKTACLTVSTALLADAVLSPQNTLLLGVLGRGSAKHPTLLDLNRRMDELYDLTLFSRNYRMGDLQILGSGAYFVDPAFLPLSDGRAIERENVQMLADSLYAPLYDENRLLRSDYTEREKTVQCDAIRDERNQPAAYAEQRSRELTFRDSPHGVSFFGTTDGVGEMTPDILTRRYHDVFPRASLRFFYVGSSEGERVAELISDCFREADGRSQRGDVRPMDTPPQYAPSPSPTRRFEESLPVPQSKLVLTFSSGADLRSSDVYTAMVYNEILGGSPTSKLFTNVREKKSLCYYCSSVLDFYKGYFSVASGIRLENRTETEAAILHEIEEMRRGHISVKELEYARRYLSSVYTSLYDSASSIESYFLARGIYGVSVTPEETRREIARVTLDDVVRYAQSVSLSSVYFLAGTRTDGTEEDTE